MKKNRLGSTDIFLSPLGLGTVKFGRNTQVKYPTAFQLPTDDEIKNLLACAKDLGINILDTAPAYGISEERIGKLLTQRNDWIITTKVGEEFSNNVSHYNFGKNHVQKSIERSLKRLNTDYLDIVLIHSNGEDEKILNETSIFSQLAKLKEQGLIRAFGMSTKTIAGGLRTIDEADLVMVTYNPLETNEREVIQYAYAKQKGIFIKKAFASGHLNKISSLDPVAEAMNFIFSTPGVSSIILGTLNPTHLKQNVSSAKKILRDKL